MDGSTDFYYLWHLVTSQYMRNTSSLDDPVLLQLNRYISLAAEIDFRQQPKQSIDPIGVNPKNPRIDGNVLSDLKAKYSNIDFVENEDLMRLLIESYWQRIKKDKSQR
jgi:hypothetical protein